MHEKKVGFKSYGGITKKYEKELSQVTLGLLSLTYMTAKVLANLGKGDNDFDDVRSEWLNGAYQMLQELERNVADLEAKIDGDPQFSDKFKKEIKSDLFGKFKDGYRKAREVDAYLMNRRPF